MAIAVNPSKLIVSQVTLARFWARVNRAGDDDCWPFRGAKDSWGYGIFSRGREGGYARAHRLAWAASNPASIGERIVLHSCDNPACCNPRHLKAGSQAENMAEMACRQRSRQQQKVACKNGHPFDDANTRWSVSGGHNPTRVCRRCNADAQARRKQRKLEVLR